MYKIMFKSNCHSTKGHISRKSSHVQCAHTFRAINPQTETFLFSVWLQKLPNKTCSCFIKHDKERMFCFFRMLKRLYIETTHTHTDTTRHLKRAIEHRCVVCMCSSKNNSYHNSQIGGRERFDIFLDKRCG